MEWNLNIPHDSSRTDEQPTHQTVPHFGLVLNHSCSWRDHLQYITSNLCLYYYVGLSGNKSWLSLYYCLWFCLISSNINSINSNTIFFISYFFFFFIFFSIFFLVVLPGTKNGKISAEIFLDERKIFLCIILVVWGKFYFKEAS